MLGRIRDAEIGYTENTILATVLRSSASQTATHEPSLKEGASTS